MGPGSPKSFAGWLCIFGLALAMCAGTARAQDQLNQVHVKPPSSTTTTPKGEPAGTEAPPETGAAALNIHPGSLIRLNTDLVLVPVTVTDPMNRLVTGLEKSDFEVFDNNVRQKITSFSCDDAPITVGIILDLSGSMSSKLIRAIDSVLAFIKTSNPQDEYFVIGFNDRPVLIENFTRSVSDIEARLATVHASHRTALLDALYYGIVKMQQASHERKALLIISDGGDNDSRYTPDEVKSLVRESDVEIFSMGIFDPYAPTPEERMGPQLLQEISAASGGRLFSVSDVDELPDIAQKISMDLRNQYVIGYRPSDLVRNGKWRKVRVKILPPPGLPPLTVYARSGYYAPLR